MEEHPYAMLQMPWQEFDAQNWLYDDLTRAESEATPSNTSITAPICQNAQETLRQFRYVYP
jgi:hypothetical protein